MMGDYYYDFWRDWENLFTNTVGILLFLSLFCAVFVHALWRSRKGILARPSLPLFFYSCLVIFCLLRISWFGIQYLLPSTFESCMNHIGDVDDDLKLASFIINRTAACVYLVLYCTVLFYWIETVLTLYHCGLSWQHVVRIDFDYEYMSRRTRFLLSTITVGVLAFTLALIIIAPQEKYGMSCTLRWLPSPTTRSRPSSLSQSMQFWNLLDGDSFDGSSVPPADNCSSPGCDRCIGDEECASCLFNFASPEGGCQNCSFGYINYPRCCDPCFPVAGSVIYNINLAVQSLLFVLFSFGFFYYGMKLFLMVRKRGDWSRFQRWKVALIPGTCSLCFLLRFLLLISVWISPGSYRTHTYGYPVFVLIDVVLPEIVPSSIFLFSMSRSVPFFFFVEPMFRRQRSDIYGDQYTTTLIDRTAIGGEMDK